MTRNKNEKAKATTVQLGGKSEHQRPGTGTKKKQAKFHTDRGEEKGTRDRIAWQTGHGNWSPINERQKRMQNSTGKETLCLLFDL